MTKAAKLPRSIRKANARTIGLARMKFDRTERDPRHIHPRRVRNASTSHVAAYIAHRDAAMLPVYEALGIEQ